MKIKAILANKGNYGGSRQAENIRYIVVHYTANDGDRAESNGRYFQNRIVNASAHYFVDDNEVVQSVPDLAVAWSVGGKKYPSCGTTGGGKWYGKCKNDNSISVELCDTNKNGRYDFTEKTLVNAAELVRLLMQKYHIPIGNVIRHFDVTGKNCPAPFVEDAKKWQAFKERLVEEVVKYYENINEVPNWAKAMIRDMIDKNCFGDTQKLHLSDDMLRTMALMQRWEK